MTPGKAIRSSREWAEALKKPGEKWITLDEWAMMDRTGQYIVEAMWISAERVWREPWGKRKERNRGYQ